MTCNFPAAALKFSNVYEHGKPDKVRDKVRDKVGIAHFAILWKSPKKGGELP